MNLSPTGPVRLGIRANLAQFSLLVGVNALVGAMLGQERTVLPLMASRIFGLGSFTVLLTFLVAFGVVKAVTNILAGTLADRVGRRPVLIYGWLAAIPVPLLLMWAPSWGWIVLANVFLGINQGLAWSATVIMKVDLAGPQRRGTAMGMNEAAGYVAVAVSALATGFIATNAGLRPEPFFMGLVFAGAGLGISVLFVRETRQHARLEGAPTRAGGHPLREVFVLTSVRERALSACSQAGMVNNVIDGLAWGLFPLWFARAGIGIGRIGVLAALYPAVWGLGQLVTGPLSDRIGRKRLITDGMFIQAAALVVIVSTRSFGWWALGTALLGAGTAMVYPTLLSAVSDVAHAGWRASAIGVYRFWRDLGFAIGAIVAGVLADAFGLATAIWTISGLTVLSGLIVQMRMYETLPAHRRERGAATPTAAS